jgi:hypothetical protein
MNTPGKPLRAVPDPTGYSAKSAKHQNGTKEDDLMNTDTNTAQPPGELTEAELRRQRIAGAWIELGCTAFALIVDLLFIAVAAYFFHTGLLPGWLDGHGGVWAWFGAGAVACWWVLVETPHALSQLRWAYWQLYSDRLDARIADALAEDGAHR